MSTNRWLFGISGERSSPCGKKDGGQRSPRLPVALVLFFTLASSIGITRLLATLIDPPRRVPFAPAPMYPSQDIGAAVPASKGNKGGESFYRTIIDNNLFRPLGWTPPRPIEPYRLLGTLLPRSENTPPRAILQSTAGNKTYIVSIGDALDTDTAVVSIESKQVTLSHNGQQRTLYLSIGF